VAPLSDFEHLDMGGPIAPPDQGSFALLDSSRIIALQQNNEPALL